MTLRNIGVVITKADPFISTSDDNWDHHAYRVHVSYNGERTWHIFRTDMGWTEDPTPQEVLETMAADYLTALSAQYEFDAEDYGYQRGSREARRLERALTKHYDTMNRVFGDDLDEFIETYQEA